MMKNEMEYYQQEEFVASSQVSKEVKKFIHPVGMLIGGCIVMLIGVFLYFFNGIPYINGIHPEFLMLVNYFGLFTVAQGGLIFLRGLIGNK